MPFLIFLLSFLLLLRFQVSGISGGDAGDLVTAATVLGVPHPPGYPLYTFLAWLTTCIPYSSHVWRISLLSSLPHALTLVVVFLILRQLTNSVFFALLGGIALLGNYIFFLYGTTPEVFALNDLFLSCIMYESIQFVHSKKLSHLIAITFVYILALSHHHTLIFSAPAFLYILFVYRKDIKIKELKKKSIKYIMILFTALLPLLYIPLAASAHPIINWEHANTISGFTRLLSRAMYGSFQANRHYFNLSYQRLLQIKAYFEFLLLDFSWFGILFAGVGFWWLYRQKRQLFWFFGILWFCTGPLFTFYASFPLANGFTLGIYERFLLQSYVVFTLVGSLGCLGLWRFIQLTLDRYPKSFKRFITTCFFLLISITFFNQLSGTLVKTYGLIQDRSGEYLGEDILDSSDLGGVIILQNDTPAFITEYVRYVRNYRPDVAVILPEMINDSQYEKTFQRYFPHLVMPEKNSDIPVVRLVEQNYHNHAFYTNVKFPVSTEYVWIPNGLLYRLYHTSDVPAYTVVIAQNEKKWRALHLAEIQSGAMKSYRHLILTDILNVYIRIRIDYAKDLIGAGMSDIAESVLAESIDIQSDSNLPEAYKTLAIAQIYQGKCDNALINLGVARQSSLFPLEDLNYYYFILYSTCYHDDQKATFYKQLHEKEKEANDIKLD